MSFLLREAVQKGETVLRFMRFKTNGLHSRNMTVLSFNNSCVFGLGFD